MRKKKVVVNKEQKSGKIINNSIPISLETKVRAGYQSAKDVLSWRTTELGPVFLDRLCDELYVWGKHETSIDMHEFYHSWGMSRSMFDSYKLKHDQLKYVYELVKEMVGVRRQKLAMYKKFECDPGTIAKTLRQFHPDWRIVFEEDLAARKEIKAIEDNNMSGTIKIIEMPRYEIANRDTDQAE